jgi:hypothetical protein
MKKTLVLFISIFMMFLLPSTVYADGVTFGIKPENPEKSYFEFTINPGESAEDVLIASNSSKETISMVVQAVDGMTAQGGGLSYDFSQNSVASKWINLQNTDSLLTMRANHIRRLPFTITVPAGTPPGEYALGFLAGLNEKAVATDEPNAGGSQFSVNVVTHIAVAVIIHVPGTEKCVINVKGMESSVESGKWKLNLNVENTGNVHFQGKGNLVVTDKSGNKSIINKPLTFGYIVPKTTMKAPIYFDLPAEGEYKASISLTDDKKPDCKTTYETDISFGGDQKKAGEVQATRIADSQSSTKPAAQGPSATSTLANQLTTIGSAGWIVWISAIVLLIGVGLTLYALSILKKHK